MKEDLKQATANPVDAIKLKIKSEKLLLNLRYKDKSAYTNQEIYTLIRSPFGEESVSAIVNHYAEWIALGFTPQYIFHVVIEHEKEGIAFLNNPKIVEEKLLKLIDTDKYYPYQLLSVLYRLNFNDFPTLLRILLRINEPIIFETLHALVFWMSSLSVRAGRIMSGFNILREILVFLNVRIDGLIIVVSNIGISRSMESLQKLIPWIEKRSIEPKPSIGFYNVLSALDLDAEQFMLLLVNVNDSSKIETIESVVSWARSLAAKSGCNISSKEALARTLAILGMPREHLMGMLLTESGLMYFEELKKLSLGVIRRSPEAPQAFLAEMLAILRFRLEQLIKLLVDINSCRSFNLLNNLIQWVKELSADSNDSIPPQDVLDRVLSISGFDILQLIKKWIDCHYEKKIETFKSEIGNSIKNTVKFEFSEIEAATSLCRLYPKIEPSDKGKKINPSNKRNKQITGLNNESIYRQHDLLNNHGVHKKRSNLASTSLESGESEMKCPRMTCV